MHVPEDSVKLLGVHMTASAFENKRKQKETASSPPYHNEATEEDVADKVSYRD
jgi:hypothetical protein